MPKPDSQDKDKGNTFPSHTFALVDHNRIIPSFASPNTRVVAVLDHHEDEGQYVDTANPRIVRPTGSAASLVGKYIKDQLKEKHKEVPKEVATLLLCAILVDTGGLKPGGKAVDTDVEAAEFSFPLSTLAQVSISALSLTDDADSVKDLHKHGSVQALAQDLAEKKSRVDHLSTIDLLKRDYKQYAWTSGLGPGPTIVNVGLSTVPIGLEDWLSPSRLVEAPSLPIEERSAGIDKDKNIKETIGEKNDAERAVEEEFWKGLEDWVEERDLDILGILTTFRDGGKKKRGKKVGKTKGDEQKEGLGDSESSSSSPSQSSDAKSKHKGGKHRRQIILVVRDSRSFAGESSSALFTHLRKGLENSDQLALKEMKMKKVFKLRDVDGAGSPKNKKPEEANDGVENELPATQVVSEGKDPAAPKLHVCFYKQGNAKATRKVTAPLMQRIVEGKKGYEGEPEENEKADAGKGGDVDGNSRL